MVKKLSLRRGAAALLLLAGMVVSYCPSVQAAGVSVLRVVCTTTALEAVISAVGDGLVEVDSVIPEQSCPGHADIAPSLAEKLRRAELVCAHDFESQGFLNKLARVSGNPDIQVKRIAVAGNWMVPDVQAQAAAAVCSLLSKSRPEQAALFQQNAGNYCREVALEGRRLKRRLEGLGLRGKSVVSSRMQEDLLRWFGFVVVATYLREEDVSVRRLKEVIEASRGKEVIFVVDNLQSGPNAGLPIAGQLRATHLIFSNFPRRYGRSVSYLKTLQDNFRPVTECIIQ